MNIIRQNMSQFFSPKFYIVVMGLISIHTAFAEETRLPTIQLTANTNQENTLESKSLTGFKHNLLEVPLNKSHISNDVIQQQNIQRVSDALSQVSGVFYQDSYGGGFGITIPLEALVPIPTWEQIV